MEPTTGVPVRPADGARAAGVGRVLVGGGRHARAAAPRAPRAAGPRARARRHLLRQRGLADLLHLRIQASIQAIYRITLILCT